MWYALLLRGAMEDSRGVTLYRWGVLGMVKGGHPLASGGDDAMEQERERERKVHGGR